MQIKRSRLQEQELGDMLVYLTSEVVSFYFVSPLDFHYMEWHLKQLNAYQKINS